MDEGRTVPAETRRRREVGGYQLLHPIGSGGMGTVYEAIDGDGGRVALKLLHPAFSADADARDRLRREVATLHRVRGARVAQVLDAEIDADEAFVVTELIIGQSLDESIREHGPMNAEELYDLAAGLASALDAIHGVGVVHRDLKPGNVMLTDDGPVVIDFGISQLADDVRLTQTGLVTGTPGYVDPAVLLGADPDPTGDWWGWSAVLLFAATGRPPFGGGPMSAVLGRVEMGRADLDGVPPALAEPLRRALHPDPGRRLPHTHMLRALDDHRHGRSATVALGGEGQMPPSYAPGASARPPDAPPAAHLSPQHLAQPWPEQAPRRPVQPWQPEHAVQPQGGPEQVERWMGTPRPRPWISGAWWLAAVGAGVLWPGVSLLLFGLALLAAGVVGAGCRSLRNRRLRHGVRASDSTIAWLLVPVHLVLSFLLLLPSAFVGLLGGGILWALTAASGTPWFVLAAIVGVTTLLTWWTPSSRTAREGLWTVLDAGAPDRAAGLGWTALGVVLAGVTLAVGVLADPVPTWAPFPTPPIPSFMI